MKKRSVRKKRTTPAVKQTVSKKTSGSWLVLVKSWMFVVMLALMLGVGTIIGTYINQQMNASSPAVAGVQIELR